MLKEFTKGIFKENPIFVLLLGLCPTLGVTTSAFNGLGMGIATLFVLLLSNIVVSSIKNFIPDKVRIPAYIVGKFKKGNVMAVKGGIPFEVLPPENDELYKLA